MEDVPARREPARLIEGCGVDAELERRRTTAKNDNALRITNTTDAQNSSLSWTYGYDLLDRLNSATKTGTTQGFTYDANGNRLTETGTVAGTYTISTTNNQLNTMTGSPARTYTYDTAGNTLTYSNIVFTYYNSGRMKTSTVGTAATTTYYHNALGQRIKKSNSTNGTVLLVFDESGHILGEYTGTGALVQETVWLRDIPVATIRPGTPAVVYYVHSDHLNAPRMVTVSSGTNNNKIAWRWDTDPFGTTPPNQNPQSLGTFVYNLRYPGQYYDSETGLNYNYFRDYGPKTGRYVESDPIGLGSGVNTYTYGDDDPVEVPDRFGLDTAQCTRRLNNVPFRVGPFFHQYVCVGNAKTGYTCRGLGPTKGMFDSPGKLETDAYSPQACKTVLPDNQCVESCIRNTFNSPSPNYSVDLSHGENCQTYANSTVSECVAKCHAKTK